MAKFRIIFGGLIAHIEYNGENRALAVKHHDHVTILNVHEDDVIDKDGFAEKLQGVFYAFKLDSKFQLQGVKAGITNRTASFLDHVPSLSVDYVLDQDLDAKAKQGDISHGQIEAILEYSGGDLSTTKCFTNRAEWDAGTNPLPVCIADGVIYEVDAEEATVKIVDVEHANHFLELAPDATIWFSHRAYGGNHFAGYKQLATDLGANAREPKADGGVCENCVGRDARADDQDNRGEDDIDCANSHYP